MKLELEKMNESTILVKIGGKILEDQNNLTSTITQLYTLVFRKNILENVIIIPGGGSYANFVRYSDHQLDLGDDLAHWQAIVAMDWNCFRLKAQYPEMLLFSQKAELSDYLKNKPHSRNIILLQTFSLLYNEDRLPHSWSVSSDSITIHIASMLDLNVCFLIKDVDGILDEKNRVLKHLTIDQYFEYKQSERLADLPSKNQNIEKETPVDSFCLNLLESNDIECIILNGSKGTKRILKFFLENNEKKKIYTKLEKKKF